MYSCLDTTVGVVRIRCWQGDSKTPFYIQVDHFFERLSYSFDLAIQQGFHCSELKTASNGYTEWDLVHKRDVDCNCDVLVDDYDFAGYGIHSCDDMVIWSTNCLPFRDLRFGPKMVSAACMSAVIIGQSAI
jgi:hypothetical protein